MALMLIFLTAVPVYADVQSGKNEPDYKTDYYMIIESKAGGIDIYAEPDLESAKLNDQLIPNGMALHIEGEVTDEKNSRTWGYTEYRGMNGYVPLDDLKPAQSRQEAIDSELYLAGKDNVDYNADFDVEVSSADGTVRLYQGPGEKYGTVPGTEELEDGTILHITQEARMADGSRWGVTSVDGREGWVDLDRTDTPGASPSATATDKTEITSTPRPTATVTPTETPANTVIPTETPANTVTPLPTDTPEPEVSVTDSVSTEELESEDASSQDVMTAQETPIRPFIWISVIALAVAAVLLFYHFKKR